MSGCARRPADGAVDHEARHPAPLTVTLTPEVDQVLVWTPRHREPAEPVAAEPRPTVRTLILGAVAMVAGAVAGLAASSVLPLGPGGPWLPTAFGLVGMAVPFGWHLAGPWAATQTPPRNLGFVVPIARCGVAVLAGVPALLLSSIVAVGWLRRALRSWAESARRGAG